MSQLRKFHVNPFNGFCDVVFTIFGTQHLILTHSLTDNPQMYILS